MLVDMNQQELAHFLRSCRERLSPHEVAINAGQRRRTPGLRREEVSQLAGMSADYYMRLEQARSPQPSTQILASLARALRLNGDERDHLFLLAGHRPPAGRLAGNHVRPGLMYLLDHLTDTPAHILTDLGDLLAQNALAEALFGGVCSVRKHDCDQDHNIVWRWFNDPIVRQAYPPDEVDHYSRVHVADLRAAVTRRNSDPSAAALVARLRSSSDEFAELWDKHEVGVRRVSRMRVIHPMIGLIELDCERLLTPTEDQSLELFTAPPGTSNVDYLELVKVVGGQQFSV